jgi:hypothetical protein
MGTKKKLIVCSDPGGANCLAAYVKSKKIKFIAVLEGSAKNIFLKKFDKKIEIFSLAEGLKHTNHIITATSWSNDLEKKTIILAKKHKIKVSTILDHWVNYKERFMLNNKTILPDEIFTQDYFAFNLAKKYFRGVKIIKIPNYYLNASLKELKLFKVNKDNNFLYLSEPIQSHYKKGILFDKNRDYDEYQSLKFFLNNVNRISQNIKKIIIRLHPSDKRFKYNNIISKFKHLPIRLSNNNSLLKDISQSSIIFGCETLAMVIALMAKKRVLCTIPPKSKSKCSLPYKSIEYLKDLIN